MQALCTNFNSQSTISKKPEIHKSDGFLADAIQKMQFFFEHQQFCDVTLIAADDEFQVKAHRMVLSASSKYFLAMFSGSLREADAKEVKLHQVNGHSLKMVINFFYTASIELETDTVEDILKTAHLFELDALEMACCDFIARQLEPSNCLGIALFAEQYNYETLYATSEAFICENFMKLRNKEEFFLLNADRLSKFLSSDELRVSSEEEVFHSIMSWVEHDRANREKFIGELLQLVRFPLLLPEKIADTVELACKSVECQDIINRAYKWHLLPKLRQTLLPEQQTKLRSFKDVIIAISGWNNTERILSVGLYYSGLKDWIYREWPAPLEHRIDFGSTTVDDKLIIAGGILPSGEVSDRVDCFDLRALKWTRLSPLGTRRHSFGMVTLNGKLYVIGGQDGRTTLNTVEKLDGLTKTWKYMAKMPVACYANPLIAVKNGSLCVSLPQGNQNSFGCHTSNSKIIYDYDPVTDIWTNWLTIETYLLGMGTIRTLPTDYFITVSKTVITIHNLSINTSATIPIQLIGEEYKYCAFSGDQIIVYGQNLFQKYHLSQNKWEQMPSLTNNQGKIILISN